MKADELISRLEISCDKTKFFNAKMKNPLPNGIGQWIDKGRGIDGRNGKEWRKIYFPAHNVCIKIQGEGDYDEDYNDIVIFTRDCYSAIKTPK
jgi:hypothetical protein